MHRAAALWSRPLLRLTGHQYHSHGQQLRARLFLIAFNDELSRIDAACRRSYSASSPASASSTDAAVVRRNRSSHHLARSGQSSRGQSRLEDDALMQQLRQCRSAPQLVKLLSDATEAGRIPSLDHYHCALQGMVVGTTPENAKGGRRSPRSQPSQPAEEERWSRGRREGVLCAFDLLGLMMRRGARKEDPEARPSSPAPTPKTFTLVLRILVNARRWKQAVDLVQSMEAEYGVAPDIVNYNSALRACAASKQWRAAQDLLQTIRLRAHVSDDDDDDGGGGEAEAEAEADENGSGCGVSGGGSSGRRSRVLPDTVTLNSLLSCFTAEEWQEAVRLWEDLTSLEVTTSGGSRKYKGRSGRGGSPGGGGGGGGGAVAAAAAESWARGAGNGSGRGGDEAKGWQFAAVHRGVAAHIVDDPEDEIALADSSGHHRRRRGDRDRDRRAPLLLVRPDVVSYNTLAKLLNEAGEHEKVLSLQRAMLRPDPLGETVEGSDHPHHDNDDDEEEKVPPSKFYGGVSTRPSGAPAALATSPPSRRGGPPQTPSFFPSPQPDDFTYVQTIVALGGLGDWRGVLDVLAEREERARALSAAGGRGRTAVNIFVLNAAITALGTCGQWQRAIGLYEEVKAGKFAGCKPDRITHNALLSACAKARRWREALRIFEDIKEMQQQKNDDLFARSSSSSSSSSPHKALLLYDKTSYNIVMNACLAGGMWQKALRLFDDLVAGAVPSPQPGGGGVRAGEKKWGARASADHSKPPSSAAAAAAKKKLRADLWTCGTAINAAGKGGDVDRALAILAATPAVCGEAPNVVCYAAAVNACAGVGDWGSARRLLDVMLDREPLSSLPHSNGSGSDSDSDSGGFGGGAAGSIMGGGSRVLPNAHVYSAAMKAYTKGGQGSGAALALLQEALAVPGLKPNAHLYSSAISACEEDGDWESALRLLREMQTREGGGVRPEPYCISSAISACARAGEWRQALRIFRDAVHGGGDHRHSRRQQQQLQQRHRQQHRQQQERQQGLYLGSGHKPNFIIYCAAIEAFSGARRVRLALEVYEEALSKGLFQDLQGIAALKAVGAHTDGIGAFGGSTSVSTTKRSSSDAKKRETRRAIDLHGCSLNMSRVVFCHTLRRLALEGCASSPPGAPPVGASAHSSAALLDDSAALPLRSRSSDPPWQLTVITGWGRNTQPGETPVLVEQMKHWVDSSFEPPLVTTEEDRRNKGRFVVTGDSIERWIAAGARLRSGSDGELDLDTPVLNYRDNQGDSDVEAAEAPRHFIH